MGGFAATRLEPSEVSGEKDVGKAGRSSDLRDDKAFEIIRGMKRDEREDCE